MFLEIGKRCLVPQVSQGFSSFLNTNLSDLKSVVSKIFFSEEGRHSDKNIADGRREHEAASVLLARHLAILRADNKRVQGISEAACPIFHFSRT